MPEDVKFPSAAGQPPDERHIQNDLAIKAELEQVLAEFHRRAASQPDIWRNRELASKALGAASELRAVDHELCLLFRRQVRRREAQRRAMDAGKRVDVTGPGTLATDDADPERFHRAKVLEMCEGYDHEIDLLRRLGLAPELVRRAARERRARLRWLLNLLADVQPEAADEIERTWRDLRARPPDRPGVRIERWERQTGDWLARFLEPMLPDE